MTVFEYDGRGAVDANRQLSALGRGVADNKGNIIARLAALLKKGASTDDVAEQVVTFCRTDTTTGQVLAMDSGFVFH